MIRNLIWLIYREKDLSMRSWQSLNFWIISIGVKKETRLLQFWQDSYFSQDGGLVWMHPLVITRTQGSQSCHFNNLMGALFQQSSFSLRIYRFLRTFHWYKSQLQLDTIWATGLLVTLLLQWTTFYYFILNVMFVYRDVFHLCGVFSTISMFMVNSVSNGLLRGEGFTEGICGSVGARIWFFMGFMMGFISFIGKTNSKWIAEEDPRLQ